MMSPVYVLLPLNGKFVAIKTPLSFFSPSELEKYGKYNDFYLSSFIESILPFQQAGESIQKLFDLKQKEKVHTNGGVNDVLVPLAPFELSDAMIRVAGPLWGASKSLEPFFITFFATEICDPLPSQTLSDGFSKSVDLFMLALLRSSMAVFLGIHLGFCDQQLLSALRKRVFDKTFSTDPCSTENTETDQLSALVSRLIPDLNTRNIPLSAFETVPGKLAAKLKSRLKRVVAEFITPDLPSPTVFGEEGIIDE